MSEQAANNQGQQAQPVQQKVKSYTERFNEMELQIDILNRQYFEASQAFEITAGIVRDLAAQIRMLNDQLQALYDVGTDGKAITRQNVTDKINSRREAAVRRLLEQDEKNGLIKKVEKTSDENHIVVYSDAETVLAFKAVGALQEGLPESLMGKGAGDTIGDMKIDSVYEIVPQPLEQEQSSQDQSNEQTKQ